jgi:hypothetical protein
VPSKRLATRAERLWWKWGWKGGGKRSRTRVSRRPTLSCLLVELHNRLPNYILLCNDPLTQLHVVFEPARWAPSPLRHSALSFGYATPMRAGS